MTYPDWPLVNLRLRTAELTLRPMVEGDLPVVAEQVPADYEFDPALARYPDLTRGEERRVMAYQDYWRAMGGWSIGSWRLPFVVQRDDTLIGVQGLEGDEFPMLRTVDSYSWLVASARGRGLGREMRRAVLALAFGPLQAQAAVSSAWQDNAASLGVSRRLGYRPNGVANERRGDGVDVMVHLRLVRDDWLGAGDVEITGFETGRRLFGV